MKTWTRTTWLLTIAAALSCIAWVLTRDSGAGWLTFALLMLAIAASYLAINEQEQDEIGPRISQDECDALAQWADARRYENEMRRRLVMGRAQDRAERRRATDVEQGL